MASVSDHGRARRGRARATRHCSVRALNHGTGQVTGACRTLSCAALPPIEASADLPPRLSVVVAFSTAGAVRAFKGMGAHVRSYLQ